MTSLPIFIHEIKQIDNHRFQMTWNDGSAQIFRLSDLQHLCPCAGCRDEQTGRPLGNHGSVKEDVRASFIRSVGRYAIQIQFASGCSNGIYSFDMLRQLKGS